MYLHIGVEKEILIQRIIGIFDVSNVNYADKVYDNRGYEVVIITGERPKSVVIVESKEKSGKSLAYLSPISIATLQKRIGCFHS